MDTLPASDHQRLKADLSLVFLTSIWGATFLVVQDGLRDADPFTFLLTRFTLGGAAVLLFVRRPQLSGRVVKAGLVLGAFLFLGFALQTVGLLDTTPSRSAFITGLSVVLVPIASIVLLGRWPSLPGLVGVALAVLGLAWLTGVGFGAGQGLPHVQGDLLTALCAVSFAFHITLTTRFSKELPAPPLVAVQLLFVALLSALCLPFTHPRLSPSWPLAGALAFCAFVAGAFALLVQTWAQGRTTAVRAALIYSLEPVFAAIYSVALGRERLSVHELGGGALIVLGVLTAEVGGAVWERRSAPAFR